jgi:hypothetical protein
MRKLEFAMQKRECVTQKSNQSKHSNGFENFANACESTKMDSLYQPGLS